jgi:amino acid transporter
MEIIGYIILCIFILCAIYVMMKIIKSKENDESEKIKNWIRIITIMGLLGSLFFLYDQNQQARKEMICSNRPRLGVVQNVGGLGITKTGPRLTLEIHNSGRLPAINIELKKWLYIDGKEYDKGSEKYGVLFNGNVFSVPYYINYYEFEEFFKKADKTTKIKLRLRIDYNKEYFSDLIISNSNFEYWNKFLDLETIYNLKLPKDEEKKKLDIFNEELKKMRVQMRVEPECKIDNI